MALARIAGPVAAGWLVLLASALLFVGNLFALQRSASIAVARPLYALAVHPPQRVPAALNGFGLWNVLVLVLMLVAYGWPLAQFAVEPSPTAIVHRVQ
jgi:cytochrome c oxidase subunit 1